MIVHSSSDEEISILFFVDCDASVTNATWLPNNQLQITIQTVHWTTPPQALGHFSFADRNGNGYRFLHKPIFVNDQKCSQSGPNQVNPYTSYSGTPSYKPGDTVDIWISVYWVCNDNFLSSVSCLSQDIHYVTV